MDRGQQGTAATRRKLECRCFRMCFELYGLPLCRYAFCPIVYGRGSIYLFTSHAHSDSLFFSRGRRDLQTDNHSTALPPGVRDIGKNLNDLGRRIVLWSFLLVLEIRAHVELHKTANYSFYTSRIDPLACASQRPLILPPPKNMPVVSVSIDDIYVCMSFRKKKKAI